MRTETNSPTSEDEGVPLTQGRTALMNEAGKAPAFPRVGRYNPVLRTDVGAEFHGVRITPGDHNLERQILDAAHNSQVEEQRGNREAALNWSQAMLAAIKARRPEVVKAIRDDDQRPQHLKDMDVLETCERCIEEQAGCPDFFGCMGVIASSRGDQP